MSEPRESIVCVFGVWMTVVDLLRESSHLITPEGQARGRAIERGEDPDPPDEEEQP